MPRKRFLNIVATASNGRAEVRIEGDIAGWKDSAATFRAQMQALVAEGVRDAHVYLNTRGGSVFEANDIVNEIKRFPGRVTGEGGALVASAGTNIMLHLQDFAMPSNGMLMIHKGMGMVEGNEDQMASYLDLLKKLTQQYREAYAKKMGITEAQVEEMWGKSDKWFTAQEALDAKLISRITDATDISEEEVQDIAACGAPMDKLPKAAPAAPTTTTMKIEELRAALGMPETATEQEVLAKAKELRMANEASAKAAADARKNEVKSLIDAAVKERKITEEHRSSFEAKFSADFEATKRELEGLKAVPQMAAVLDAGKAAGAAATVIAGRDAWTYDEWATKDEKGLLAMANGNAEAQARFQALYEAKYGRKAELPAPKA
ncbi:MAG: Clp protease ClpP [Flavobacteriales bacterium]|nr:Clp protease ClpP [Flavobacteriales bacterium]